MSLVITQRPTQTISGETSTWNGVGTPIVYKLQRKDFTFNQVNNSGGFVQLQFNAVNLTSSFAIGDNVYLKSDNGTYDISGKVTAESFSTNTLITLDVTHAGVAPGGFVNNDTLRGQYSVLVNLYDLSAGLLTEDYFTYSPDMKGLLLLNVSEIIKSVLTPDNNIDLTSFGSEHDSNVYQGFNLGYTEAWVGSSESETVDSTDIYASFSALQIPSLYGGNMALYNTFNDGTPKGKFLTKLDQPVMWRGWPFALSIIVGDNVSGDTYFVSTNGNTGLETVGGSIRSVVLTDTELAGDTELTVKLVKDSGSIDLSEVKTIEIKDPCDNAVMLMARNELGGPLQWLFDHSQEYTHDYGDGRKAKRVVLTAENISMNQWEALQDFISLGDVYTDNIVEFTSSTIKTSTRIGQQVYVVNQDGSKIGVIVIPTKNKTLTRYIKHQFEIEIEYPEAFVP